MVTSTRRHLMALPDFLDLDDPARNLSGLEALEAMVAAAPPLNPNQPRYYAYDGTPIGYGSDCDPISTEPELSGLLVPDFLEENRLAKGQQFAMPLTVGTLMYATGRRPLAVAGWTLASYMAPLLVGAGLAFVTLWGAAMEPQRG